MDTIAGFGSAISPNFVILTLFRFLAGLGVGTIMSSLMPLAAEVSPPSKRGVFVAIVVGYYTFGMIYVAVAALIMFGNNGNNENTNTWRFFFAVCTLPCFVALILVFFFVPESARYLAMQKRMEEACKEANRVADSMGYLGPPLEIEELYFHYGEAPNYHHSHVITGKAVMQIDPRAQRGGKTCSDTMKMMIKPYSEGLWKQTLVLQILTFAMSFGSGLNSWITEIFKKIHLSNIYMHSIYFALSNIPGAIAAALLIDRMGRTALLASSTVLSSISLFIFSQFLDDDVVVTIMACLFHAFLVIARNVLLCVTSEIFPTEVRATGVGLCGALGRLASLSSQYVYGGLDNRPDISVIVSSSSILGAAALSFFLREMSNQPLADGIVPHVRNEDFNKIDRNDDGDDEDIFDLTEDQDDLELT